MGVLDLPGIPWERWFKLMLPAQIYFFFVALVLLAMAFLINYR
jgi:uncharacterized ion transporter superfamily protein YfcC